MASDETLKEGRVLVQDGDIEFDVYSIDGICLPPFPPVKAPGGFSKRIKDIKDLDVRPDDVILATYPKCGTHWTSEILNMLLQGKAEYQKSIKAAAMLEAIPDLKIAAGIPSPRVLNLHLPYRWFPRKHVENGGKIVHVTRNPKDAYVSLFYHTEGGFELGPKCLNKTWKQFFDNCVVGEVRLYGTWFDYEREMAAAKKVNKNIYTLRFEDLKNDSVKEITKLAEFLGVKVSEDLAREIAEKCSFKNLKQANEEVKEPPPELKAFMEKAMKENPHAKPPKIYRKGEVGDWKNHFTVAQNEMFNEIYKKEMEGIEVDAFYEL